MSITSAEALVDVEWFGELIGAACQLDDDVFLLWFAQLLLHLLEDGGEVRGIGLEDLLGDKRFASEGCKGDGKEDGEFHGRVFLGFQDGLDALEFLDSLDILKRFYYHFRFQMHSSLRSCLPLLPSTRITFCPGWSITPLKRARRMLSGFILPIFLPLM